ncbi:MAG TPA: DUF1844 domain-containing protein [Acidobacteriota bacterium]|nr:DUF1844 domain-containing protein [Acidobacteriota bacterium]
MAEKKNEEIRVEDRRFFDKDGNPASNQESAEPKQTTQEDPAQQTQQGQQATSTQPEGIDFISILFTYVHTCLIYLGEVKDPEGQTATENLEGARQMIDILEVMQQKTKGNLTTQEEKYLESALFDLRMRFMKKAKLLK